MTIASFILSMVLLTLAFVMAVGCRRGTLRRLAVEAKRELPYILLFVLAAGGRVVIERSLASSDPPISAPETFQALGCLAMWTQSVIPREVGVPLFGTAYVLFFVFVLAYAPLRLLSHDIPGFRRYCLAISIASLSLAILHVLFLSLRPGLDPGSGIAPLLYQDATWGPLSSDLISRGQSLPSGHTTVVTIVLMSLWRGKVARSVLIGALVATMVGVLYLGLHWPVDVAAGLVLGWACAQAASLLVGRIKAPELT